MTAFGQFIKRAYQTLVGKDDGEFPMNQGTYNDKTADIEMQYPYGYCANAPQGSLILLLNVMGQEENRAGFVNFPQKRFRGLKEGEVKIGNFLKLQSIFFDEKGNIVINTPEKNVIIEASKSVVIKSADTISIETGTNVYINSGQNIVMNAAANIRLNAPNVEVVGKARLKLDAGGNGVTWLAGTNNTPPTDLNYKIGVTSQSLPYSPPEHELPGADPGLPLVVDDLLK